MGRHKRVVDMNCDFVAGRGCGKTGAVVSLTEKQLHDRRVFFAAKKLVKHYLNPHQTEESNWARTEIMKKLCDVVTDHPDWGKK